MGASAFACAAGTIYEDSSGIRIVGAKDLGPDHYHGHRAVIEDAMDLSGNLGKGVASGDFIQIGAAALVLGKCSANDCTPPGPV